MSGEYLLAEEIAVPQHLVDAAYRHGLKAQRKYFLDDLRKEAVNDYFFDGQRDLLVRAFADMSAYLDIQSPSYFDNASTKDWKRTKLTQKMIDRLGYLIYQDANRSPVPRGGENSARRPFQRSPSVQSEEYYDEDFEDFEAEAEEVDDDFLSQPTHRFGIKERDIASTLTNNFVSPSPSKEAASKPRQEFTQQLQPRAAQSVELSHRPVKVHPADPSSSSAHKKRSQPPWIENREWRLGENIGSGSFGEVFKAMNYSGKLFAVKRMNIVDKASEVKNLLQEIRLMSGLSHKNIVQYIGACVDDKEYCLYIFQEWVPGGSLQALLKQFGPFPEATVRSYTRQILTGLQYLHNHHIVHRDIKGGNVLVDDNGTVKLADFGASTTLNDFNRTQETTTIKGTPYFMAPEVLSTSKYGRKGDIWAVGCTMIQMITGEPPWKDQQLKSLIQLHILLSKWEGPPSCGNVRVSPPLKECLDQCFHKNPEERPSAAELLHCTFLRDNDELDESLASSGTGPLGASLYKYADFADSFAMRRLETAIDSAVSKSRSTALFNNNGGAKDSAAETIAEIDRRLRERQSPRAVVSPPYAVVVPSPVSSPSSSVREKNALTPNRPVAAGDNPFAAKARPAPLAMDRMVLAPNPSPRDVLSPSSSSVNSSVHLIKKKISEASTVRGSLSRSSSRANSPRVTVSNRYSQSSNRDSEELTPQLPDDGSESEDKERTQRYGSRYNEDKKQREERVYGRHESKEHMDSRYDTPSSRSTHEEPVLVMKKSASSADSLGPNQIRRIPVPRLSTIERSSDKPPPSAAKSASARMTRISAVDASQNRPYTSKAALGLVGSSRSNELVKKAALQGARFMSTECSDEEVPDSQKPWQCQKCKAMNTNPNHCDYCATRRGITGKRDVNSPLVKR